MTNNEKRAADFSHTILEAIGHAPWEKHINAVEEILTEALNAAQAEGYKQGAESKWLPIESAPKDGTEVLVLGSRLSTCSGNNMPIILDRPVVEGGRPCLATQ